MALIVNIPPVASSGAPSTSTFITQTPDASLSAEQALSLLATGLVKNTTGTGVLSTGVANTDFLSPVPPVIIDGTGLTTTVPLLVKNGKNLSGIELQVTGTAPTGYVLNDSTGTRKGALGFAVALSDWITGVPAGGLALRGETQVYIQGGTNVFLNSPTNNTTNFNAGYLLLDDVSGSLMGYTSTNRITIAGAGTTLAGPLSLTGAVTLANAINIIINTSTGSKIGTGTTQKIGFWNAAPIVQPTNGADLTNNVTSGGTSDTVANFTDLTIYANDSAAIRNDIYQLARKLKVVNDALRLMGLLS